MRGDGLTVRQHQVLAFVCRYLDAHGVPPSLRNIAGALGIRGDNGVPEHIAALARKGWLQRAPGSRALRVLRRPADMSRCASFDPRCAGVPGNVCAYVPTPGHLFTVVRFRGDEQARVVRYISASDRARHLAEAVWWRAS